MRSSGSFVSLATLARDDRFTGRSTTRCSSELGNASWDLVRVDRLVGRSITMRSSATFSSACFFARDERLTGRSMTMRSSATGVSSWFCERAERLVGRSMIIRSSSTGSCSCLGARDDRLFRGDGFDGSESSKRVESCCSESPESVESCGKTVFLAIRNLTSVLVIYLFGFALVNNEFDASVQSSGFGSLGWIDGHIGTEANR